MNSDKIIFAILSLNGAKMPKTASFTLENF